MIGIIPITIEQHYFKILIPGKVILSYVFNDPVVLRFMSLCINDPHNNSYISYGRKRARPVDVILPITFGCNTSVLEMT
jgi:hypothetical protein